MDSKTVSNNKNKKKKLHKKPHKSHKKVKNEYENDPNSLYSLIRAEHPEYFILD